MTSIERIPFGRTGHQSSRVIFGAAALGGMKQARADATLALLDEFGVNHIDTAASYGDSELRLAPFLKTRRQDFFLATKTGERAGKAAREQLERSLNRLGVDQVDLIQLHNLVEPQGWQEALGPGGALEAMVQARDEGLVRFIGVTGHGTYVAQRHLESLDRFPFDSILLPCNYAMLANPDYRADFDRVVARCRQDSVAIQTIKAIARRRWRESDEERRFSWYAPLRDQEALTRAVQYVLCRPGFFLNSTSDATLLPAVLRAAAMPITPPADAAMAADQEDQGIEPLFVRDVSDDVIIS